MAVVPLSELAPRWAWAVLDPASVSSGHLSLAETVDPEISGFLVDAAPVSSPYGRFVEPAAEAMLADHGFEMVTPWRRLPEATHRMVAKVRPTLPVPQTGAPVPYARNLARALQTDRDGWDEEAIESTGPPPGWVNEAILRLELSGVPAYGATADHREADPASRARTDYDHGARATLERFLMWFGNEVRTHGWPRYGIDPHHTIEQVLWWTVHFPDDGAFATECCEQVRRLVAAGEADPAHLVELEAAAAAAGRQST